MLTMTIGPARPRLNGHNRQRTAAPQRAMLALARVAARHGPTTILDSQGGAMVLGGPAGDIDLF
ncbi:hypothetical protein M2352_004475 [Azospirillum fermentarium]|uniref:hypothetical protein n=1 Tax=Azospirillum fermentarium TaxID=1233114 RepID=UPI002226A9D9|nr:hypothetical protein [Azospirillum fermentarium]MCW2248815.1 hypothetical protein [Azospirillum fermentarium]